jgi:branched-chain amino acid transport system substrate-binding protein
MTLGSLIRPGAVAALALLLLVPSSAPGADPIRVGYLGPLTGIFAAAGKDMLDGLKLAFEQVNYETAGRKIELVEEDDEGNPATAQAKYRKLVAQDRIHVLDGILLINIGYALVPNIERDRLPSLFLTTPDEITKRKPARYVIRSNFAASQPMHALGDYAAKTLKYKRVATIAMDNGFGHEGVGGFQRVFEELGGRVAQKTWVPLNAMDFAPYLTQVPRDVDAVVQVFVAGQAVRFAKQYGESALHGKVPLIGTGVFTDQSSLQGMGDEVIGHVGALIWAPTIDNPANRAFVQLAEAKVKRTPSYFHAVMYSSGRWIIEAAKALGGQVEDRDRFLAALRRASDSTPDPRGPIKLDEYGNPTQNVYIVKVEKVDGRLQNTVIHTYPMVSQFWTYKADEFLKTPPYDRNYPPVKP